MSNFPQHGESDGDDPNYGKKLADFHRRIKETSSEGLDGNPSAFHVKEWSPKQTIIEQWRNDASSASWGTKQVVHGQGEGGYGDNRMIIDIVKGGLNE